MKEGRGGERIVWNESLGWLVGEGKVKGERKGGIKGVLWRDKGGRKGR